MGYKKTFEELLQESASDVDSKRNAFIDDSILPAILNRMDYRMRYLTKTKTFKNAKELFVRVMEEVCEWFTKNTNVNKGYRLTFTEPDHHGYVTINLTYAIFSTSRACNLSTFVRRNVIFNATNDYLYQ